MLFHTSQLVVKHYQKTRKRGMREKRYRLAWLCVHICVNKIYLCVKFQWINECYFSGYPCSGRNAQVGPKVADCICLMSLDKTGAIPVDTHVWSIAQVCCAHFPLSFRSLFVFLSFSFSLSAFLRPLLSLPSPSLFLIILLFLFRFSYILF